VKDIFLKFLKIFLIAVAVVLAILVVFGVVLILDWPWWTGVFLLVGLLGLGIGFLFLRKIWLRRREQRFVQQVIEHDEAHLRTLAGKEREDLKELQDRWREAVETLRRSHLRKYGNPLYVLPWYLVIGESGSGKTTAISSARLSSPFAEVSRTSGLSGTRNCDWWFFEQAIILDTAGRYAIPVDEGRDKEEWQKFLNLLVKYRRKEPLHGLIVTIAADKLLEATTGILEEDGRNIRRRIDEMMRALGTKIPVYVLVTKCDRVQGMAQFCDQLPAKSLDQAMGTINHELSTDVASFLDQAFSTIGERLRNLRVLLLHKSASKAVDPGLLLFPEEFGHLRQGLGFFIDGAFRETRYQETPILRGLFFSSGRQEGAPFSHFLQALGLIGERDVLPGTDKGLFLHDFFARVLPKDKGLLAPTQRALQWRILTRNLGLVSWVALGIAICGLLSFSFVKNLKALREGSHEFAQLPVLRGEVLADINTMERFRRAILKMENQNRGWWVPRFGLNESINAETGLKEKYCAQFQRGFLASFDKQMGAILAKLTDSTPDEMIGPYVAHLVRRINLLKARLEDQGLETIQKKPQPPMGLTNTGVQSEVKGSFGNLYLYYLIWRSDSGEINKEITILQSWLNHVLTLKGSQLRWLVTWANQQDSLSSVTLGDFWGGSLAGPDGITIAPAFTHKGKDRMDVFLQEIESALPDPRMLDNQRLEFKKWHRNLCFEAWYHFATSFSRGVERLQGRKEWQQTAAKMATEQGPYFALLNRMASELEPVAGEEGLPPWLRQVYEFQLVKAQGSGEGLLAKAAEKGKKLIGKIEKGVGKEGEQTLEYTLFAAKAYQEYRGSLAAIAPIAASTNQAYQIVSQVFTEDPVTSKSPFFAAHRAVLKLKTAMGTGRPTEEGVWPLITGPIEYLWAFARMETACYLQTQWEQTVLAETQGATTEQAAQLVLGQEGPVWKFVKGPAAPFMTWSLQRGYHAREALGGTIPFEAPFLSFLRQSARRREVAVRPNYNVLIKGLPTDANPEARLKPHSTRLELQCAGSTQSLINQNYPVSKNFPWAPGACGDVIFQIEVGDIILTRTYTGDQAFIEFLQDFRGGQRTFYPQDFPRERAALDRLGIRYIRVRYQFSGHQSVLGLGAIPSQVPRNIARCWGR
jgi:type VI secretion system protein ImpL